ncbi:GerAB/ArcD/ProY family transporter [Paenibacillus sp. NEAU-GSW1]|uniref:GerAB/ArcD/ProY family transporter n=1 Tax=Paenibacillus sp. NEAU-GSW1 TaxID=2682486 RepID=UPI0012E1DA62|nr:GerAB/ArcD/ProY family transporter [Paenibacillus sp. NEAU-GSW1]MUT67987.1 GerAB/ArcD/ProY family transporter [Paenibacillus sp. NEAU-GSW1]
MNVLTERIDTPLAVIIVSNMILGSGILSLPRVAAASTHTPDAWLAVVGGGLLTIAAGTGMALLSRRYPDRTIYEFIPHVLGRAGGFVYSLLIIFYFLSSASFQVSTMAKVSGYFLLEGTPSWVVISIFIWVGLYLMVGGIESIARISELLLPPTVLILLILLFLSIRIFEWNHVLPIGGSGVSSIFHGLKSTSLAFSGAEAILFVTAFMSNSSKSVKAVIAGIMIPMIIYVAIVFLTIGALTVDGTISRTWPLMDVIRSFEIPGLVFERFESLLLVTWIMQIFTSFTVSYFGASLGLACLFGISLKRSLFMLLPFLYVLIRLPRNIEELSQCGDFIGNTAIWLFGGLPWILLLVSITKEKMHAKSGSNA